MIGLLGGSFNPAHGGHVHLSLEALKKLKLDEIWWLVSPQNPLKSKESMAAYEQRLQSARRVAARQPRIRVLDVERRWSTRYTWQTIERLKQHYPRLRFVWLMGADNLAQFHRWQRWQELLQTVPIAVFDRAPYSHTALRSKAYIRARRFLLPENRITAPLAAPALLFVHMKRDPLSSTALRAQAH